MGEKNRQLSHTRAFLLSHTRCIFCSETAEEIDHIPPKRVFRSKQWPEGFEFPACMSCNQGSKDHDQLFSLLVRLCDSKDMCAYEREEMDKILKALHRHFPELGKEMNNLSIRQRRNLGKSIGMAPESGKTYSDLPFLKIPEELSQAITVVSAKITKALFYKHSEKILPTTASIRMHWFTNINVMTGNSPLIEPLLQMLQLKGELVRNNASLRDQFDYRHNISPDHTIAVFACVFSQHGFGFVSFAASNGDVLEKIIVETKEKTGISKDVFKKVEWPITTI